MHEYGHIMQSPSLGGFVIRRHRNADLKSANSLLGDYKSPRTEALFW